MSSSKRTQKARAKCGQMWKPARDNKLKVEICEVTPPQKVKAKLKVYIQARTAILEEIKALISLAELFKVTHILHLYPRDQ